MNPTIFWVIGPGSLNQVPTVVNELEDDRQKPKT